MTNAILLLLVISLIIQSIRKKKTKIYIAVAALVVVAGIVAVIALSGNKYTATTMRLLRVEGTVYYSYLIR